MHSLHGSAASVATESTSSGVNGASTLHKHHRLSSRSNSVSSASVVTVKRTGSLSSSSTAARNSTAPMKAQSPTETSLIALKLSREPMSQEHKRRKSVAVDPTERASGEWLGSVHRLSHSTSSSVASISNPNSRRSRASSGAVLPPLATYTPKKRSWAPVDHSPRASPQRKLRSSRPGSRNRLSPTSSPERERQRPSRPDVTNSLKALPPLHTTPALTDPNDTESPSTIQIATPSTQSSYGQDYFGDETVSPRSKAKSKKPLMIRNHTSSMSAGGSSRLQMAEKAQEPTPEAGSSEVQSDRTIMGGSRIGNPEYQEEGSRPPPVAENRHHRRNRTHERGEKDKKQMLSRALQKANTAVLLDNAQNFEGALEAYNDACRLLQQVMDRSSGAEDKRKLDAIRVTYINRIEELHQFESAQPEVPDAKSLPARPMSDDSLPLSPASAISPSIDSSMKGSPVVETATATHIVDVPKLSYPEKDRDSFFAGTMQAVEDTSRRGLEETGHQVEPETVEEENNLAQDQFDSSQFALDPEPDILPDEDLVVEKKKAVEVPPLKTDGLHLPPPEESRYMPAPLSPRRPSSPKLSPEAEQAWEEEPEKSLERQIESSPGRENSDAPNSWLDTIDESSSSRASSVHSVSSQQGLHRKYIRGASGETNPDFDAAFDAAVEAAYNEGLEPDLEGRRKLEPSHKTHAQNESIVVRNSQIKEILSPTNPYHPTSIFPLAPEDEEEERLLDDITQDYSHGFNFDLSSKSALPRQSDSSGYSRSTWQSSQVSDRTTAGTSLSTVAEDSQPTPMSKNAFAASASLNTILSEPSAPPAPPPQTSLPKPPSMSQNRTVGVRGRRLSGQIPKQLKIQTSAELDVRKRASTLHSSASPSREDREKKDAFDKDFKFGAKLEPTVSETEHEQILRSPPSLDLRSAVSDTSRPMTATTVTTEHRNSRDEEPGELTIHRPNVFKKSKSSVSLREHMVLLASPTVENGPTAMTPMSSTFMTFAAKRNNETPLTTQRANLPTFGPTAADSLYSGGVYLFDSSLSTSTQPTSPRPAGSTQPGGLEPCPESFLLRPFWLMRTISSTLTHPKGGYLTTRLFVPREVWLTRGVKLKSVEDKIANCDLLTAALGRLAGVDTYDADAIMEELQNFEEVMERVQAALVKKIGNDVGVSGLSGIFKEASSGPMSSSTNPQGADTISGAEKTRSKESKGYLNSWRKLRSKSSGAPIGGSQTNKASSKMAEKELPTMDSVPMTSYVPVERRGHKKDVRNLAFEGPNREYMGSLARLFEGVQVLGKIHSQFVCKCCFIC